MPTSIQRLYAMCLTGLFLCQAVLAGVGGLQLCLPSSGSPLQLNLNCNELNVELCCGDSQDRTLVQASLAKDWEGCHDLKLEAERNDPCLAGERDSSRRPLELPIFIFASRPNASRVEPPSALFFAEICPKRAPPQVNDALRHFRDVVSLRI